MSNTDSGNEASSNNRWWEFYTVRYLLGTAIGTIVLLFLVHHHPDDVPSKLVSMLKILFPETAISGYQAAILGLSGLAYCYIASAPILFLHALRHEKFTTKHTTGSVIALIISSAAAYYMSDMAPKADVGARLLLGMAALFLFLQVLIAAIFVWLVMRKPEDSSQLEYYKALANARGYANKAEEEFIESYRHLREHGNALLIVLLEIILAILLYYSPQNSWGFLICFWILPGAWIYFFAQFMEREFVKIRI